MSDIVFRRASMKLADVLRASAAASKVGRSKSEETLRLESRMRQLSVTAGGTGEFVVEAGAAAAFMVRLRKILADQDIHNVLVVRLPLDPALPDHRRLAEEGRAIIYAAQADADVVAAHAQRRRRRTATRVIEEPSALLRATVLEERETLEDAPESEDEFG